MTRPRLHRSPRAARLALAALLLGAGAILLGGCATLGGGAGTRVTRESARQEIEAARGDVEAGRPKRALRRLADVREARNLTPDDRAEAERLLRVVFDDLLEAYEAAETDPEDYLVLHRLDLPPTMRATAGILAAERMLAEGHPVDAYKQIRDVDRRLPEHNARLLGGEVLGRIGLDLVRREGTYSLFFSYRARGVAALEYLVVQYPLSPACPEAYVELSRYYEDEDDLDYAIERLEDLIVYHPTSSLCVWAEARLPELRLQRLPRDDYDRSELVLARREADRWLARHAGDPRTPEVQELARRTRRRLARSDLVLARYYRTVESPFGSRLHAERALEEAREAGSERLADQALAILASLPSLEEAETGSVDDAERLIEDVPLDVER